MLVSGALLLAACGDDDEASPADDQETADEAIAAVEQALRDDGFTASPSDDDEDDNELVFPSAECREFDAVAFPASGRELPDETARATSQRFARGTLESTGGVEENVAAQVFVDEPQDLDPFFEMLNDERLGPCFEEAIRIASGEGADQGRCGRTLASPQ